MKKLPFTEAQIVQILGQAEASDITVADVCRLNGISENTFYRWHRRYGDMESLIRWEKRPEDYLATLHLAGALITWRASLPA